MAERISENREGACRQHYMLGLYASLFCWLNGLDGCRIERKSIERVLGLVRIRQTRMDWIAEDLERFFSNVDPRVDKSLPGEPWSVIYLSRLPINKQSIGDLKELTLWPEIKDADAARSQVLGMLNVALPDEKILTAVLALLASGQVEPNAIPNLFIK